MSSVKTLFVAALLVAGLYVAYRVLNYNPEITPPPEVAGEWNNATLSVDPGKAASTAPRWSSEASASPLMPVPAESAPRFAASDAAPASGASEPTSPDPYPSAPAGYDAPLVAPPPALPTATAPPADTMAPPNPVVPAADQASLPTPIPSTEGPTALSPEEASELARSTGFGAPAAGALTGPAPPATDAPLVVAPGTEAAPAGMDQPPVAPPITPVAAPAADREDFATFVQRVSGALAANRLGEAHLMLSERYRDPNTPPSEAREMEQLLDQLAGTVVYSPESLLEAPYEVLSTDTLETIADRYNVPPGLLAKINALDPRAPLTPGQRIKVVRGPFEAIVDATKCELTLMLGREQRYAGRFAIGVGPELRQEGTFMVTDKKDLSTLPIGGVAPPDRSRGTRWIGLGSLGLHGTIAPGPLGRPVEQGCISLGQRDIEDLYDILTVGSKVTIRR